MSIFRALDHIIFYILQINVFNRVTGVIKVHLVPGEVEETADQRATQV